MKTRILGLFVVALLVLAACGEEGGGDTTTTPSDEATTTTADAGQVESPTMAAAPTTAAPATTAPPEETTTTAAEAMDGVHVAETDLGPILVDADGFTLYVFTQDSGGESVCYDDCAALWPPVPGDTAIGSDLDASIFGAAPRTDGTDQLTVNGMPLYRYTPDANPGDTMGQGVGGVWFVVDADGSMIEASADQTVIDYGY